jgi:single-strand DNA-binding protein
MLNNITIHGRLTANPELKQTQSQVPFCTFTVAVNRSYTQGDEKITDFFNCIAWRGLAEMIASYFSKGKEIVVHGEMNNNPYEKDGQTVSWWQLKVNGVDFCGKKEDNGQAQAQANVPDGFQPVQDEDIPF